MDKQREFEALLNTCKNALERFVFYKMNQKPDGEDILQEVYLTAFSKFDTLIDKEKFKPWIIAIARNKINDFYRAKVKMLELPLDEKIHYESSFSRMGLTVNEVVSETLSKLADKEKQILYLYYIKQKSQNEIASMLNIPLGTVKSRLYTARQRFREKYPYPPISKGEKKMSKFPDIMPDVSITKINKPAFHVIWEEAMGWFIIPKLGERISWAMYDYPQKTRSETVDLAVVGKAMVHGIEGVEIVAVENSDKEFDAINSAAKVDRTFVMQLTETHTRILLESHHVGDVKRIYTFLDEEFLKNWGYGEDNCGNETHIKPKGIITVDGDRICCKQKDALDVVGRYEVTVGKKTYDTILVVDVESYNGGVMSQTYLDKNGRTVLWRRFNKDDWAYKRYQQKWSERLPQNEKVYVNGETYVHWYDCITDYIL
ncbi:MAG: RNA polymerase sigma factor [Clostridia bacterium]